MCLFFCPFLHSICASFFFRSPFPRKLKIWADHYVYLLLSVDFYLPNYIVSLGLMSYMYNTPFPNLNENRCYKTSEKPGVMTAF
jgi:hypothetical protein